MEANGYPVVVATAFASSVLAVDDDKERTRERRRWLGVKADVERRRSMAAIVSILMVGTMRGFGLWG
jgi:hypothetical protein